MEKIFRITLLLCMLFFAGLVTPLFSEVFFTERALQNYPEYVEEIMRAWRTEAAAVPGGHMDRWLRSSGEPGYMGDVTVDINDDILFERGSAGTWSRRTRTITIPSTLREPILTTVLTHEAGHAYFDERMPLIDMILPPRHVVAMTMIREISAILGEARTNRRINEHYNITETFTEKPNFNINNMIFFWQLEKYIKDTNPAWDEDTRFQAACNEFIIGYLQSVSRINRGIDTLAPQFFQLMDTSGRPMTEIQADNRYFTPPVLNRRSNHYMLNINTIMRTYLQAALPAGVMLTVDVDYFMQELSRNIDIIDEQRAANGQRTTAQIEAIFSNAMQQVEILGSAVRDGGMVISQDTIAWLDSLVDPPLQNPQVVETLRAMPLYRNRY